MTAAMERALYVLPNCVPTLPMQGASVVLPVVMRRRPNHLPVEIALPLVFAFGGAESTEQT